MNYNDLKQEEIIQLDRIVNILEIPALNKSLILKICGISRMSYVNYKVGKYCAFNSTNIESLRLELLRLRSEIKTAFNSKNRVKVQALLANKEIMYTSVLEKGCQARLSGVRTKKRNITLEEIDEIEDAYISISIQINI